MRPIISYDDIAPPQVSPPNPPPPPAQPPAKKRKTNQNQRPGGSRAGQPTHAVQHWDDPGSQGMQMSYEETPKAVPAAGTSAAPAHEEADEEDEEEESRELTHEEIWDDSALIDAWNSAAAEYEVRTRPHLFGCRCLLCARAC